MNTFRCTMSAPSTSLTKLIETVWYSLDDILVCVGVFIVAHLISESVFRCLKYYFRWSIFVAEASKFVILFATSVFLIGHLVGPNTANSLFGGFSIGLGYAMQPYIVSLLAGGTFRSSGMLQHGDLLKVGDNVMVIDHVGLLFVTTKKEKFTTYFPNSVLAARPFSVSRPL